MPCKEQIAEAYYSLIGEGAAFVKEDKNIKDHDQAARRLEKGIAEIAKECTLEIIFGDVAGRRIAYKYNNKLNVHSDFFHLFCHGIGSVDFKNIELWGRFRGKEIGPMTISKLKDSQYRGILFALNWGMKKPNKENLESLKEVVSKMKLEHSACEKLDALCSAALKNGLDKIRQNHKISYCVEQQYCTHCLVSFKLGPYCKLHVRINYAELLKQLEETELALQKSIELSAMSVLQNISLNKNFIGE